MKKPTRAELHQAFDVLLTAYRYGLASEEDKGQYDMVLRPLSKRVKQEKQETGNTYPSRVRMIVKTILKDGPKKSKEIEQSLQDAGLLILRTNWQRAAKKVAFARQIKGQGIHAGWEWVLRQDVIE